MVKLNLKYYKLPAEETIRHEEKSTCVFIRDIDFGVGTLYVAESGIFWRRDSGEGFKISYQDVPLLGISSANIKYNQNHIFIRAEPTANDISYILNCVRQTLIKIVFIPKSCVRLQQIFRAIKFCSRLSSSNDLLYDVLDVHGNAVEFVIWTMHFQFLDDSATSSPDKFNGQKE